MNLFGRLESVNIELPLLVMVLLVISSSIAVIYSKHIGRAEFIVLQKLEHKRDQLNVEWGRLLLEQSTWASPGRVEQQARLRLKMVVPSPGVTVLVKP